MNLQDILKIMSLHPGEDIGVEKHPNVDQFLRIEQGQGIVQMGNRKDNLNMQWIVLVIAPSSYPQAHGIT